MTTKFTVAELLEILDKKPKWLIKKTGLSATTIYRNLDDSPEYHKTQEAVAAAIANALGVSVNEIKWPRGLSERGRPAYTGKNQNGNCTTETTQISITVTVTRFVTPCCPIHHLQLSVSGNCSGCE